MFRHNHESNCPPRLENTIWWAAPVLVAMSPLILAVKLWDKCKLLTKRSTAVT